jgi:hypothetical protein
MSVLSVQPATQQLDEEETYDAKQQKQLDSMAKALDVQ